MRSQRSKLQLRPYYDASLGRCMIRCKTALWAPGSILLVMKILSGTFSLTEKEPSHCSSGLLLVIPLFHQLTVASAEQRWLLRMKNSELQPGQNGAGAYRCADGWIRLGPLTAKLANWPRQPGIRGTGGAVENESVSVMNTVLRKATHGSLIYAAFIYTAI